MTQVSKEWFPLSDGTKVYQIKFWDDERSVGMFYPVIRNGQIYDLRFRQCLNYAYKYGVLQETIHLVNKALLESQQ